MQAIDQLAISPSGFVFDPRTGGTFSVNETAATLLQGIREGLGLTALTEQLQVRFTVTHEDLQRDVFEFVRRLQSQDLLDASFELGA